MSWNFDGTTDLFSRDPSMWPGNPTLTPQGSAQPSGPLMLSKAAGPSGYMPPAAQLNDNFQPFMNYTHATEHNMRQRGMMNTQVTPSGGGSSSNVQQLQNTMEVNGEKEETTPRAPVTQLQPTMVPFHRQENKGLIEDFSAYASGGTPCEDLNLPPSVQFRNLIHVFGFCRLRALSEEIEGKFVYPRPPFHSETYSGLAGVYSRRFYIESSWDVVKFPVIFLDEHDFLPLLSFLRPMDHGWGFPLEKPLRTDSAMTSPYTTFAQCLPINSDFHLIYRRAQSEGHCVEYLGRFKRKIPTRALLQWQQSRKEEWSVIPKQMQEKIIDMATYYPGQGGQPKEIRQSFEAGWRCLTAIFLEFLDFDEQFVRAMESYDDKHK